MGDLSEHFSRHEFTCSGENCCGGSSPIDGRLVEALEEFRHKTGKPVHINSGFRCLVHNRKVGSDDLSQHPRGYAADVRKMDDFTIEEMATLAKTIGAFGNGGIGCYDTFIHLDVRQDGPARWEG